MSVGWLVLGAGLNDHSGDASALINSCYAAYHRDFYGSRPTWPVKGKRFSIKRSPMFDNRCGTFRHLTTEGPDEATRTVVESRCRRIEWPRKMLDEFAAAYPAPQTQRIRWWKTRRGAKTRYVISLVDFSYVVVVEDKPDYVMLWTAYPVEYSSKKNKLLKEFEAYWGNSRGRPA